MTHRKRVRTMMCVLVAITLMITLLHRGAFATSAEDGRRIVTFQGLDLTTQSGYLTALGLVTASGSTVVHKLKFINALAIKLPLANITGALLSLLNMPYVLEVSEDPLGVVDPIVPSLAPVVEDTDWGIEWIEGLEIRRRWPELKGAGVKVAVLDTGIDSDHPDLNVGGGYNAIREGTSPKDQYGHGTHMAGIIGAKLNGEGIGGMAPAAKVVPVKVLDDKGSGHLSDLLSGMQWVYNSNIQLANMSLQFRENHRPLEKATKRLYERGVIMVAAAGNHCSSGPPDEGGDGDDGGGCEPSETDVAYPAAYSKWVIAVGATDYYNRVTAYSRSGPAMVVGGVVAPGGSRATHIRILSTTPGGGYGYGSGTSPAAAHVSGVLALALELRPQLSFEEAVDLLKITARDLGYPATQQGAGLIDAAELVEAIQ